MKTIFLNLAFLAFCLMMPLVVSAQFRTVNNQAFQRGEKLTYVVYFDAVLTGSIKAAYGTFEVMKDPVTIGGRKCYHIVASGETFPKWNWAIYVKDRFESYVDETAMMSWLFLRRAHEGNYEANQDIVFNHYKKTALYKNNKNGKQSTYSVPMYVQDMISAAYYARAMELPTLAKGTAIPIPYAFEDSLFSTSLVYMGTEDLKIGVGKFNCLKFKPRVLKGSVFNESYPLTIWVTNDKNRIPIFAKTNIVIGNVKFELVNYSGIKNPMTSKLK